MSNDLKKVGLIYNAEGVADFVKSLKSVNAEIRENYNQMKITQSSWDQSTKTSEKLQDRLANLTRAHELYDKKLRVLNEDLKALKNNEEATEDQIKSKEAQIRSTEAELARYEKRIEGLSKKIASGTADIEDFGRKLQKTGDTFQDIGKKASIFTAVYTGAMGVAIKKASDWESAWVDVLKVTDGTDEQLNNLAKSIRNMSQELPVSANEIAEVVESASKLGVGIEHVEDFAETMVKMEIATGISAAESATAIARFAEVTQMSFDDVDRLGSVIAELGDNYATTEKEIIDMGMGLAAAGSQVGMHQSDIMALATALSSVGLEAQAGGSAMSKLMVNMELATQTGEGLVDFANVAGVSGEEFADIFQKDATKAISMFIQGLSEIDDSGGSAIKVLDDMGIKEVRLRDTLLRAANASDTFTGAIEDGSRAWEENTKLNEEAELQAQTLANQWQVTKNMIEEVAITFGEIAMPVIKDFVALIQRLAQKIQGLSPIAQKIIVVAGGLVALMGPMLIFIGKIISAVGLLTQTFSRVIVAIKGIGLATMGLWALAGAAVVGIAYVIYKNWDSIKEWTLNLIGSIKDAWNSFKEWFSDLWVGVKTWFSELISGLSEWFIEKWNSVKERLQAVWSSFKEWFVGAFTAFKTWFSEVVSTLFEPVKKLLSAITDFIKNFGLLIIALGAMLLEKIWELISPFVEKLVAMFNKGKELFTQFIQFIHDKMNALKEFVIQVVTSIREAWNKAMDFIKTNIVEPFRQFVSDKFEVIRERVLGVVNRIKEGFQTAFNFIRNNIIQPLVGFFTNVFETIRARIQNRIDKIQNGFQRMKDAVQTMFYALRDTIANIFKAVVGLIKAPINGVIKAVNGVLSSMNKIKVPKWVPGLGGEGINFSMIPMLAKGGNFLGGSAIVGERGPELLQSNGGRTTVTPLSDGGGAKKRTIDIDYRALAKAVRYEFEGMRLTLDEDGFVRLVDDRLLEVL